MQVVSKPGWSSHGAVFLFLFFWFYKSVLHTIQLKHQTMGHSTSDQGILPTPSVRSALQRMPRGAASGCGAFTQLAWCPDGLQLQADG